MLDRQRGILFMVAAAVGFAVMNSLAKLLANHGVPSTEIAFARSAVGVPMLLLIVRAKGLPFTVRNQRAMWLRALAGSAGLICTFHALSTLPLSEATALQNTTPLFVALLGFIFLGEKVRTRVVAMLIAGFVGVVLILRPQSGDFANGTIAVLAGAFSAVAMVSLRKLGATETPEIVVLWFAIAAACFTFVLSAKTLMMPAPIDLLWMVVMGAVGTVSQIWMTRAYALDIAARVGGGAYVNVVVCAIIGAVFFAEPLAWVSAIGIAVILLAGFVIALDAQSASASTRSRL
ncbi:MAG: DMT family transporter [Sandaracinaceae bacterium]|jgi:drug/metabolite transporter (DMT)-like permease|nr:DMT family transporter [Sandaracinaceae bacterium]